MTPFEAENEKEIPGFSPPPTLWSSSSTSIGQHYLEAQEQRSLGTGKGAWEIEFLVMQRGAGERGRDLRAVVE